MNCQVNLRNCQNYQYLGSNIFNFIDHNQTINSFFKQNATNIQQYTNLVINALTEGFKTLDLNQIDKKECKRQKSPKYNVAYIKHNRFLSPSQKRQVTPKVTEMIPVSPSKVIIYGKPKVKLADGYACPMHQQNCQEEPSYYQNNSHTQNNQQNDQIYSQLQRDTEKQNIKSQDQIQEPQNQRQLCKSPSSTNLPRKYEQFLSPKRNSNKNSTKNNKVLSNNTILHSNSNTQNLKSPKNKNLDSRMTSPKALRCCNQNYQHVQSRIKGLIQRDKKTKQLQQEIEKQKSQIQDIYSRQNQLLQMQENQKRMLSPKNQNQHSLTIMRNRIEKSQQINDSQTSSITSLDINQSIVNLHGHRRDSSRVKCYDCQIERLKKRKQRAKQAIREIALKEKIRSQCCQALANSSCFSDDSQEVYNISYANRNSQLSYQERSQLLKQ